MQQAPLLSSVRAQGKAGKVKRVVVHAARCPGKVWGVGAKGREHIRRCCSSRSVRRRSRTRRADSRLTMRRLSRRRSSVDRRGSFGSPWNTTGRPFFFSCPAGAGGAVTWCQSPCGGAARAPQPRRTAPCACMRRPAGPPGLRGALIAPTSCEPPQAGSDPQSGLYR